MVERKRRKKNKVRGERTHGKGDTKNNRGGGCRGGRGNAGATKGKFASIGRLAKRQYRLKPRKKGKNLTIGKLDSLIDRLVENGKVTKEKDTYIVDSKSGYEKILGQGTINKKIILKINASAKAIKKIKDAGGQFKFDKKGYDETDEEDFEVDTVETE